jgi:hypothetical protein
MTVLEGWTGAHGRPVLRRGLRVDHLVDERLVLDPASGVVHRVRGAAVKALDAIVAGRAAADDEVVAALAGTGIVDVPGVSRRDAILLAGSAAALVASVALPSAIAAASTVSLAPSGGSGDVIEYTLSDPVGARLFRLVDLAQQLGSDTSYRLTVSSSAIVDVLLVAGGGAGGSPGATSEFTTAFYAGGGGGGEVSFLELGTVPAGTILDFTVAGFSLGAGRNTTLSIDGTSDSATALGGGQGASRTDNSSTVAAQAGGSGGGGSASNPSGGTAASGAVSGLTRTSTGVSSGGAGDAGHTAGAGGGGAGGTGAASSSTAGGAAGAGVLLASVTGWDLAVTGGPDPTEVQNRLGSGGGGAGSVSRGLTDQGGISGRGGFNDGGGASSGGAGAIGSGGGGGGGLIIGLSNAATGAIGGSGVVWVRTR